MRTRLLFLILTGDNRVSKTKVYLQYWKEWAAWWAQEGVPNNSISEPILADFLLHLFRFDSLGVQFIITILLF